MNLSIPIAGPTGGAGLWASQYDRFLANGGDTLVLLDTNQRVVDTVSYDDKFPWPVGADGLGASDEWRVRTSNDLTAENYPKTQLKYRGYSLQRLGWERTVYPGDDPATWGIAVANPGE